MYFPYCWPLTVLQGWEVLKGRLFLAVISGAAGVCWAWAFRTITQGRGSQICFWMFRRSWEQFPRQPSQFAPAFMLRTVPCMKEPELPSWFSTGLCACSRGFLRVQRLALFFSSELFCSKKARWLSVLPTALLVIVTTTRSNPAVISSKHLLPVVCFSFLLEYFGLTEP